MAFERAAKARKPARAHAMAGSTRNRKIVVWFRGYDLRVHDNAPLMKAVEQARKAPDTTSVYPLFVFDRRAFSPTEWSSPKTDGHRARFLVESVNDLKLRLRSIDSDLLVSVRLHTTTHGRVRKGRRSAL